METPNDFKIRQNMFLCKSSELEDTDSSMVVPSVVL